MPVVRGYMLDAKGIAEAISADLAKLWIKTSLKTSAFIYVIATTLVDVSYTFVDPRIRFK